MSPEYPSLGSLRTSYNSTGLQKSHQGPLRHSRGKPPLNDTVQPVHRPQSWISEPRNPRRSGPNHFSHGKGKSFQDVAARTSLLHKEIPRATSFSTIQIENAMSDQLTTYTDSWNPFQYSSRWIKLPCEALAELVVSYPVVEKGGVGTNASPALDSKSHRITLDNCTDVERRLVTYKDLSGIDLNTAPPNWLAQDDDTPLAVRQNCPWSPPADSAMTTFPTAIYTPEKESARSTKKSSLQEASEAESESCDLQRDFVASAETLQRLFSVPHQPRGSPLALTLHRVGKAIVVDGSSLHPRVPTSVQETHERSLRSKMLYYSVLASHPSRETHGTGGGQEGHGSDSDANPRPCSSSTERDPSSSEPEVLDDGIQYFTRALRWRFRDLHVLLGTNVPIFQDSNGRSTTLKLHDTNTPLTRLEAVSMWLENVLCNVSQVALCYHTNGIIQGYQVCNTQDIPFLSADSAFEPLVVQEFSGRVLEWLKEHCVDDGTSYVLVKDPATGTLKLYNVNRIRDTQGNPLFRYPMV